MNRRFRTLAALLALVAFSASFAEELWASTCTGDGSMPAMDSMQMEGMPDMATMQPTPPASAAVGQSAKGPQDSASASAQPCPLTAIMGSCGATSLPAIEIAITLTSVIEPEAAPAPSIPLDLLVVSLLPHPPRA